MQFYKNGFRGGNPDIKEAAPNRRNRGLNEPLPEKVDVLIAGTGPAGLCLAAQLAQFQQAQGQLGTALSRLLVVAENYPDLKATANFRDLQAQLEGTENRITVERSRFNATVQTYNTKIKTLPTVFFAGFLGFQPKPYFQATAGAETAPAVKFDFGAAPTPAK